MGSSDFFLPAGTRLAGEYELGDVIGIGGMAVVYRATQLKLGRTVAVKILNARLAADETFRRRFRREAELAASLDHPNLVTVHDVGEDRGRFYLVMQLVEGDTLADRLSLRTLSVRQTLSILGSIAAALDHAHARRLLHRDIKPHNILLERGGAAYLADFGLAKGLGGATLTAAGGVLGTVRYVAPEQIRGERLQPATDVYSLAMVAYECLTGAVPYLATSDARILSAHLEEAPLELLPTDDSTAAAVYQVLAAGLEKTPERRPATATAFVEALRTAFEDRDDLLDELRPFEPARPAAAVLDVDDWMQDFASDDTAPFDAITSPHSTAWETESSLPQNANDRWAKPSRHRWPTWWPVVAATASLAAPAVAAATRDPAATGTPQTASDGATFRSLLPAASAAEATDIADASLSRKPSRLAAVGRRGSGIVVSVASDGRAALAPPRSSGVASSVVRVAGGQMRRYVSADATIAVGQSGTRVALVGCSHSTSTARAACNQAISSLQLSRGSLHADPMADIANDVASALTRVGERRSSLPLPSANESKRHRRALALSAAYSVAASAVGAVAKRHPRDPDLPAVRFALARSSSAYHGIAAAARAGSLRRDRVARAALTRADERLAAVAPMFKRRGYSTRIAR